MGGLHTTLGVKNEINSFQGVERSRSGIIFKQVPTAYPE